ncbi:restriction endonuclease subunit S [Lactobacillus amylovorus]|uniref:Restriction endonuclease subunit S n=1 Tax=Lactobacillus amylovorus TaxID=1604 RepID=A0A9X3WA01_LACAM|nr:restriction endonuclease subunit S [Lactobacillus amylovorus]MDB6262888.1 restriction endonuclease subunit S [Lactobacillus amylovorus]
MIKKFDEVFVDKTRLGKKIPKEEYKKKGKYIIIDQGKDKIAGFTDNEDGIFTDVPTIIFGDHTRIIKYIDKPFFLGADGVKVLKSKINNANYKYLYYALKAAYIPNTGYNRHFKWLKKVSINYPSFEKQKRIVKLLDNLSEVKNKKNEELKLCDTLIKARFVEMFGDPQGDHSKWKKSTIKECCTLKSGKTLSKDIENEGGNIPYVKVKDMNNRSNTTYITTSSRFVSNKTAGKGIFPIGTVIFPKRGGAIGTNKKRLTKVSICADLNIMGVVPDITKVNPQYLFAYFNTIDLRTFNNGSSIPQINNKDIDPLNINLPPLSLQNDFAAFVKQVDKSKVAIQKSLDETQILFDSLMQKYFS